LVENSHDSNFISTDKLRLYVLRMNMYEYGYVILKKGFTRLRNPYIVCG